MSLRIREDERRFEPHRTAPEGRCGIADLIARL